MNVPQSGGLSRPQLDSAEMNPYYYNMYQPQSTGYRPQTFSHPPFHQPGYYDGSHFQQSYPAGETSSTIVRDGEKIYTNLEVAKTPPGRPAEASSSIEMAGGSSQPSLSPQTSQTVAACHGYKGCEKPPHPAEEDMIVQFGSCFNCIREMKAKKDSYICRGYAGNLDPHFADKEVFARFGVCIECVPNQKVSSKPGEKRNTEKYRKDQQLLQNIEKCIKDVLDPDQQKYFSKILTKEDKKSGELLYNKIKHVSMVKTPQNWSKKNLEAENFANMFYEAYDTPCVVYAFNRKTKKVMCYGKVQKMLKVQHGGIKKKKKAEPNPFLIAEQYIFNALKSHKRKDPVASYDQSLLASIVLNAMKGIKALKTVKAEPFQVSPKFDQKWRTKVDNIRIPVPVSDSEDSDDNEDEKDDKEDSDENEDKSEAMSNAEEETMSNFEEDEIYEEKNEEQDERMSSVETDSDNAEEEKVNGKEREFGYGKIGVAEDAISEEKYEEQDERLSHVETDHDNVEEDKINKGEKVIKELEQCGEKKGSSLSSKRKRNLPSFFTPDEENTIIPNSSDKETENPSKRRKVKQINVEKKNAEKIPLKNTHSEKKGEIKNVAKLKKNMKAAVLNKDTSKKGREGVLKESEMAQIKISDKAVVEFDNLTATIDVKAAKQKSLKLKKDVKAPKQIIAMDKLKDVKGATEKNKLKNIESKMKSVKVSKKVMPTGKEVKLKTPKNIKNTATDTLKDLNGVKAKNKLKEIKPKNNVGQVKAKVTKKKDLSLTTVKNTATDTLKDLNGVKAKNKLKEIKPKNNVGQVKAKVTKKKDLSLTTVKSGGNVKTGASEAIVVEFDKK